MSYRQIRKSTEIYDAKISFVSLVDRPANQRPFLIAKANNGMASFLTYGRILKADSNTHYVTGVVYEPDVPDADGDFMTAEEIEKAAHYFLKNAGKIDIQHSFKIADGVSIVESWITPDDTSIGDETVAKGTWLIKAEITDTKIWDKVVDGSITGFSMGGFAFFKSVQHYLHGVL